MSALLIVLSAAEPLSSPVGNEVQKYTEFVKSQVGQDIFSTLNMSFLVSLIWIKLNSSLF